MDKNRPVTFNTIDEKISELEKNVDEIRRNSSQLSLSKQDESLVQIKVGLSEIRRQIAVLEDERRELHALSQIGRVINSSLDLDVVLRIVIDTMIGLIGAERGFLMVREEDNRFVTRIARDWEQESVDPADFAISKTVIDMVIQGEQPILTTNASIDPRFNDHTSVMAFNLRSILCVPLKLKQEIIGVIYADNRMRVGMFTTKERDLLVSFANQAAVALENARLYSSVKRALTELTQTDVRAV